MDGGVLNRRQFMVYLGLTTVGLTTGWLAARVPNDVDVWLAYCTKRIAGEFEETWQEISDHVMGRHGESQCCIDENTEQLAEAVRPFLKTTMSTETPPGGWFKLTVPA